jgi:hypothetical protein
MPAYFIPHNLIIVSIPQPHPELPVQGSQDSTARAATRTGMAASNEFNHSFPLSSFLCF